MCKEAVSNLKEVIEAATEAVFVCKEAVSNLKEVIEALLEAVYESKLADSNLRATISALVKVPKKDPVNDPVAEDADTSLNFILLCVTSFPADPEPYHN